MADPTGRTRFRFWLWLIRFIGLIVPRRLRADWRQEWEAELRYREALLADWAKLNWQTRVDLLWRSLGAFRDALWLQQLRWEDDMFQDLRFGARMLLKQKTFTAVAVLTLALGIGVNTAIFSVVNAFLLRPLPYGEPGRLVMVDSEQRGQSIGVSFVDYEDWRTQNNVFEDFAFFNLRWHANLEFGDETETLNLTFGTPNLLSTLQVSPLLGHGPAPDDPNTVLLSHSLWQRRFGGDPNILGRQLRIDGQSLTVIGVMAPDFRFPFQTDLWWLQDRNFNRESRGYRIDQTIARLKSGVVLEQARAEMQQIAARLAQTYPDTNDEVTATVSPLRDFWFGNLRTSFRLLLGACSFVLLIACANVANLRLTQATARERELAVRAALGASRGRLVRQSLSESLLLASIGCASGLVLGAWSLRLLVSLLPAELLPFFVKIKLDWRVLTFTLMISVLTGIVFGLIPAVKTASVDLNRSLKEGGKSGTSPRMQAIRGLLVVTEIALAIVLLVGAGLMLQSFARLRTTSPGFTAEGVLHLEINPTYPRQQDYNVEFMSRRYRQLLERIAAVPGVVAVAANSDLPFVGQKPWYRREFSIEGQPIKERSQNPLVNYQAISPDYFGVMQIPLLRGRVFNDGDTVRADGRRDVAIINRRLAERMWPNDDPVGKRLNCDADDNACAEIVGIVGDVKHNSLNDEPGFDLYYACYQSYSKQNHFVARTESDPLRIATAIKQAIWQISPDTGVFNVTPVARLTANTIWQSRIWGLLFGIFSALGLVLAAAGIYGVMAYFVAQRTREIGIRMALGAQRGDMLKMVLRSGMTLVAIGLIIGLAGAFSLTRLMKSLLFGVSVTDFPTFLIASVFLAATAFFACYLPALRATRVDPMIALRQE